MPDSIHQNAFVDALHALGHPMGFEKKQQGSPDGCPAVALGSEEPQDPALPIEAPQPIQPESNADGEHAGDSKNDPGEAAGEGE